jgi:hypothetical protein
MNVLERLRNPQVKRVAAQELRHADVLSPDGPEREFQGRSRRYQPPQRLVTALAAALRAAEPAEVGSHFACKETVAEKLRLFFFLGGASLSARQRSAPPKKPRLGSSSGSTGERSV